MKKLVLAAAAVAVMSTGAVAQGVTVTTGAARPTVQIEPEARTKIRSYVTEHKVRPAQRCPAMWSSPQYRPSGDRR